MVKIKGSLLLKKQIADIASLAVLEFKEQFKNLDLELVKSDYHYIIYIMNFIEKKCNDPTLMSAENRKNVDKKEILNGIIKGIYPNITEDELKVIDAIIGLVISQGLVKIESKVSKYCKYVKKKIIG